MNVQGNDISIDIGASSENAEKKINRISTALKSLRSEGARPAKIKVDSSDVDKASRKVGALSKVLKSLGRVAFYRAIRSAIKAITQAFSEGLEQAYLFSKSLQANTEQGGRFAAALDNIKSASNQMKGQLGSAFISLITLIEPILIRLIQIITAAADILAQFFAAFTGSTYLRANFSLANFADNTQRGARAAKEWRRQLMGFDEINRLNEPNQGGGGSAALPNGFDFSDVEIDPRIKEIVNWIQEHLDLIKGIALAIGAAILTWKLGEFVLNLTKIGTHFSTLLGIVMAVAGAVLLVKGGFDAWENGVDWGNLAEMVGGVALVVGGLALAFGSTAAGIGALVGGIALLVVGLNDWIKTGELSTQTFWLLEAGIAAVGIGLSLLTGSWIPLAIAGVVGLVLAIYKYWEPIKEWFANLWDGVKKTFSDAWEGFKTFFSETVPQIIQDIADWFGELPYKIGYALGYVAVKIGLWLSDMIEWVKTNIPLVIEGIVSFFQTLPQKIKEKMDKVRDTFKQWAANAKAWLAVELPLVINSVINWFSKLPNALVSIGQNLIAGLWNGILSAGRWLIDRIAGYFGAAWQFIGEFFNGFGAGASAAYASVPQYATGGFPEDGIFMANHGELVGQFSNGKTAVANNDQIVEGIRQGVFEAVSAAMSQSGGETVVRVYLDSREIYSGQQRLARAMGV